MTVSKNLQLVSIFNKCGNHPVKSISDKYIPTSEGIDLREELILSELEEFADGAGRLGTFAKKCGEIYFNNLIDTPEGKVIKPNTNVFNPVKVLDALNDLEVVVLGGYNSNGFTDVAQASYEEVMKSNMSKFLYSIKEAEEAIVQNPDWYYEVVLIDDIYVIVNEDTHEVVDVEGQYLFTPNELTSFATGELSKPLSYFKFDTFTKKAEIFVLKRKSDGKIMKGKHYFKPDYNKIFGILESLED